VEIFIPGAFKVKDVGSFSYEHLTGVCETLPEMELHEGRRFKIT
jgi:hypothetical protein